MRNSLGLVAVLLMLVALGFAQKQSESAAKPSAKGANNTDEQAIRQLESDLLKAEMNTDPKLVATIFADDWTQIPPNGVPGQNKAKILENFQDHNGEAPPYSSANLGMHIELFGDTAVATYVKELVANANHNVAHQDVTDIFTRNHGSWKLRLTRTSPHQEP